MDIELEENSKWSKIRENLNQKYQFDSNWEDAILLFDERIRRKYFAPIQLIIDEDILEGEGFTIVTVQCALIEMLASFRQGKIFNHNRTSSSPKYEYKESKKMFTSLLRSASIFQDNFWEINSKNKVVIDKPYSSTDFYENVRCGLMHEARTKGNWHINANKLNKSVETEKIFIITKNGKIKIYRTVLHYRLLNYLAEYENELRTKTIDGNVLRKHFARKLDHLFDYNCDNNFDWWNELKS